MKSATSIVKKYLLQNVEEGYNFTVKELQQRMLEVDISVTEGGISGFCFNLAAKGILTTTRDKREFRYTLVDKAELENVYVREASSKGSQPGVPKNHHRRSVPLTPVSVAVRLLEFAQEVELMKPDIKTIPTSELLKELMRREGKT